MVKLDPKGMVDRIFVGDHLTALGLMVSEKKIFKVLSLYSSI